MNVNVGGILEVLQQDFDKDQKVFAALGIVNDSGGSSSSILSGRGCLLL